MSVNEIKNQKTEEPEVTLPKKSLFDTHWEPPTDEDEIRAYSNISVMAVIALVLGVLSFSAFLYPVCLIIAYFSIVFSLITYFWIIRPDSGLLGRNMALIAISCSIISAVAVSIAIPYQQYTLRVEADRFCKMWFDVVQKNNARMAIEMKAPAWNRKLDLSDEQWWKSNLEVKGSDTEALEMFLASINDKVFKTLLALGDKAEISYNRTKLVTSDDNSDSVIIEYAVTLKDAENKPETFFVDVNLKRSTDPKDKNRRGWSISGFPYLAKK
ncbi:MAG: hypothetical protein ACRC2T_10500 [Thermoguttaceae bacterium]